MKKTKIGKIQLRIGIVLLLVAIIGVILFMILFKNIPSPSISNVEDTTKNIIYSLSDISSKVMLYLLDFMLLSTSIILFFVSLLFITQGLANKSE